MPIMFSGGNGASPEDAVCIKGAKNSIEGVSSEYKHLEKQFGKKDKDWKVISQSLINENNRYYDKIIIENLKQEKSEIFFDITDFFGKGIFQT